MPAPTEPSARAAFALAFGADPSVAAQAPSRVELLGNHTDYNGGLVLAAAIDRYTSVVGRAVDGGEGEGRVVAANFDGQRDVFEMASLGGDEPRPDGWPRYVRGVAWAMGEAFGRARHGFEAAISGDVPLGAGLSSSASLQAALAVFFLESGTFGGGPMIDEFRMRLAQVLKTSENEYVGVGSGLLDQFSVLMGRSGHALMLDCRTLAYERLPMGDPAPSIVVCDSRTSRRLADGMYNLRREECERVVDFYRGEGRAVSQLRDLTIEDIERDWDRLDPVGRRRARHVVQENERVRAGAEALKAGDLAGFGRLMGASHASSRDDFENSSAALDALVEAAEAAPGFLGGKLSGAGWAGCTVNLVAHGEESAFAESVRERYSRATGTAPIVHVCRAADGASAARA